MLCLLMGIIRGHLFLGDFSIWFALDVWSGLSCLKNVAPAALPGGNKNAILQSHEYKRESCWQCFVRIANVDFCCWWGYRVSIESFWVIMFNVGGFKIGLLQFPIYGELYFRLSHCTCISHVEINWLHYG